MVGCVVALLSEAKHSTVAADAFCAIQLKTRRLGGNHDREIFERVGARASRCLCNSG